MDKKLYENFLIFDILYKTLIGAKPSHFMTGKADGSIELIMELDIYYYLAVLFSIIYIFSNITQFTRQLDILVKKVVVHMLFFFRNFAVIKID